MIRPTLNRDAYKPLTEVEWALLHTVWVLEHHHPNWRSIMALNSHHALIDSIIKRWERQRVVRKNS